MSDDNNVKPIRKGIMINEKIELKPIKPIQDIIDHLKTLADSGELREFTYIGITNNNDIYSDCLGDTPAWPHVMFAQLNHITQVYYDTVFLPTWLGTEDEEWE